MVSLPLIVVILSYAARTSWPLRTWARSLALVETACRACDVDAAGRVVDEGLREQLRSAQDAGIPILPTVSALRGLLGKAAEMAKERTRLVGVLRTRLMMALVVAALARVGIGLWSGGASGADELAGTRMEGAAAAAPVRDSAAAGIAPLAARDATDAVALSLATLIAGATAFAAGRVLPRSWLEGDGAAREALAWSEAHLTGEGPGGLGRGEWSTLAADRDAVAMRRGEWSTSATDGVASQRAAPRGEWSTLAADLDALAARELETGVGLLAEKRRQLEAWAIARLDDTRDRIRRIEDLLPLVELGVVGPVVVLVIIGPVCAALAG